jgi:hypothetical protein
MYVVQNLLETVNIAFISVIAFRLYFFVVYGGNWKYERRR